MTSSRDEDLIAAARAQVEGLAPAAAAAGIPGFSPQQSFPGYEVLAEIHRGGQGVVYLAMQSSTGRQVAIKVLRADSLASRSARARFEREVRVLASLHHPGIVAVHDSGKAGDCFYCVMDYIPGRNLDQEVAAGDLSVQEQVALFARISEAVATAHFLGIIHRDLKPGNIRVDPQGNPLVLDFGLAKYESREAGGSRQPPIATHTGEFVGSVPWASPEQVEGAALEVRSDVYSLGVVFYQMLTGQFPYPLSGSVRQVFDNILHHPPAPPRRLRREIGGDLETILLQCLQKDPQRRYASAAELSHDLTAVLQHRPISARRDSAWYVLRKLLRRHWAVSTLTGLALVLSLAFVASLVISRTRLAEISAQHLATAERLQALLNSRNLLTLEQSWQAGEWSEVTRLLEVYSAESSHWLLDHYRGLLERRTHFSLQGADRWLSAAFAPSGRHLAVGALRGPLRLYAWPELKTNGSPQCIELDADLLEVRALAFHPDQPLVATVGSGGVDLFDFESRQHLRTLTAPTAGLEQVVLVGAGVFAATTDGRIFFWSLDGRARMSLECRHARVGDPQGSAVGLSGVRRVALDPATGHIASAGRGQVKMWNVQSPEPIWESLLATDGGPQKSLRALSWHPQGSLLAVALAAMEESAADRTQIQLLDARDRGNRMALLEQAGLLTSLAFSACGQLLYCGFEDGQIRQLDLRHRGLCLQTLRAPPGSLRDFALHPAKEDLATVTASAAQSFHFPDRGPVREPGTRPFALAYDPQGQWYFGRTASAGSWQLHHGDELIHREERAVTAATLSPSGTRLALATEDGKCWFGKPGAALAEILRSTKPAGALALDDTVLVVAGTDGGVQVLDLRQRTVTQRWNVGSAWTLVAVDAHSGTVVGASQSSSELEILSLSQPDLLRRIDGRGVLRSLALLESGQCVVAGGENGELRFLDVRHGDELGRWAALERAVEVVVFDPGSRSLLAAESAGWLRRFSSASRASVTIPGDSE
jgi:serine/threonine protein kinase/WD40 repeat protein